jgi:hypothetical protein
LKKSYALLKFQAWSANNNCRSFVLIQKNQKIKAAQLLPKKASLRREINELDARVALLADGMAICAFS